jgi:thiosulfate reductase cytochrome b subunit
LQLLISAVNLGFGLFPMMDIAQRMEHMAQFDSLHKQYEWASQMQLVPLLAIAGLTAWRDAIVTRQ